MKFALRFLVSVGIAVVLLSLLLFWGGVAPLDALDAIRRLPPEIYLLSLGMHFVTYCLRALRFRLLIPRKQRPGFRRSLIIASAHNMASYVLPAKTGEASLPVYLKVHCGVPASVGLAALLVSRFLDGAVLSFGFAMACFWIQRSGQYPGLEWLSTAGVVLVIVSTLFVALSLRGEFLLHTLSAVLRWLRVHHWRLGEGFLLRVNRLAVGLRAAGKRRRLRYTALITVPVWLNVFAFYLVLAHAMGLPEHITFAEGTFGASLAALFNLLPVNGAAGIGTQELGWVTGFHQFLGVDYELALSTGLGVHLVQLFNIVVMGFLAHLAMGLMPKLTLETDEDQADAELDGLDTDAPA